MFLSKKIVWNWNPIGRDRKLTIVLSESEKGCSDVYCGRLSILIFHSWQLRWSRVPGTASWTISSSRNPAITDVTKSRTDQQHRRSENCKSLRRCRSFWGRSRRQSSRCTDRDVACRCREWTATGGRSFQLWDHRRSQLWTALVDSSWLSVTFDLPDRFFLLKWRTRSSKSFLWQESSNRFNNILPPLELF